MTQQRRLIALLIGPIALTSLVGCCCLSGKQWPGYASVHHEVDGTQLAAARESFIRHANEQIRAQSPDDNGLFNVPTWSEIRKSKKFNGIYRLFGYDVNEEKARREFQQAEELFRDGEYGKAAPLYKNAAIHAPDTEIEEDGLFMVAECHFFSDRYSHASDAYTVLLEKYENSRHLDRVVQRQFSIARYWTEVNRIKPHRTLVYNFTDKTRPGFDTHGEAMACFESVRLHDPTGPLADDSIMATANAYFINDRYDDADYYYELLRSDYPKSEHVLQAYTLGLRSKLRKYAGPQYDSTSLIEAEELIQQMLTQFPSELGDERPRVLQAGRSVRAQLAERDWEMGEFYHKTKYYGAAGHYYGNVVREYSDTQFATMAQERLEQIKDLPASPPRRWDWLEEIIPGSRRRKK